MKKNIIILLTSLLILTYSIFGQNKNNITADTIQLNQLLNFENDSSIINQTEANKKVDEVINNATNALKQIKNIEVAKLIGLKISDLAEYYDVNGYPKQAVRLNYFALSIFELINDDFNIGQIKNRIGVLYTNTSQFDEAIKFISESYLIFKKINNIRGMAMTLLNLANPFQYKGDNKKALELNQKAYDLTENTTHIDIIANSLGNSAIIYTEMGNYEDARFFFNKALDIFIKGNFENYAANCLSNIGSSYFEEGKFDKAKEYYLKAKVILEKNHLLKELANNYGNIGAVYQEEKRYVDALKYQEQSLKICKEIDQKEGVSYALLNIGCIYDIMGFPNKAIPFYLESLKICDSINSLDNQKDLSLYLSNSYKKIGNFERAFHFQSLFIKYNDSLMGGEKTRLLNEMNSKYQGEKKQQQIELQNAQIEKNISEINRKNYQRNAFIGFTVLLLLVAILVYRSYKQKKKANYLLNIQKNEISKQKDNLQILNVELEQQKEEITAQRDEIDVQNQHLSKAYQVIEQKNKNITDSIKYALRIQSAILPPQELINHLIPNTFVLYKPKSIVSGDFYYLDSKNDYIYFAAVDCTGHGVPGAFMSIVGYNLLNQALNEKNIIEPHLMLNYLSEAVSKTLRQNDNDSSLRDGMDLVLCRLDKKKLKIQIASVHNSLYLIRNSELIEFKGERWPIGKPFCDKFYSYSTQEFDLINNDILYLFSDGYMDQFNGETGKKFTSNKFKELLLRISTLTLQEQQIQLNETFENWKANSDQIDDVMVLGIKI